MTIIVNAGNARVAIQKALDFIKAGNFEEARALMKEANEFIRQAHISQTDVIQSEMSGEKHEPSLLFNHAQDTIMNVMSESIMAEQIISLFEVYDKKLNQLKKENEFE